MNLTQVIAGMCEAIQAERQAVQKALGSLGGVGRLRFASGRRIHADPGAQVYRLMCDVDFVIPDGTRVQLQVPGHTGSGETLRHDVHGDQLECVFREDLGAELPQGTIEFDSTFLLNLLEERLKLISGGPGIPPLPGAEVEPFHRERALAFLTGDVAPRAPSTRSFPSLAESQQSAVRFAMAQEIAYLWGPPGTGKTQTVAQLTHALLDAGEKVLITAHTNIATDNALLRVLQTKRLPRDSVIRVGYHAESLSEYEVGLDEAVDRALHRSHPQLVEEITSICRLVMDLHPGQSRVLGSRRAPAPRLFQIAAGIVDTHGYGPETDLPARIASVGKLLEALENAVLGRASLVATTLTRCYSSKLFRDFRTDAVVVDEASTASLTLSFVAACAARRRAIAVGDFKQLPTIVQAETRIAKEWLGRHVFETSGADEVGRDHPLRVMLHEQWRMHPGISSIVSRVFYGARLQDAPDVVRRAHQAASVALLDTSRIGPRSESTSTGSKVNRSHAALIAEILKLDPLSRQSVAVITPYRAQVRAIRDAVRAARPELLSTDRLEIFTVHRFQGRDKDVVLFDLAEAPGTGCQFLNDIKTPHAPNLLNVAMSRARERLVVIGAFDHLRSSLGSQSTVSRVLIAARTGNAVELVAGDRADTTRLEGFLRGEDV